MPKIAAKNLCQFCEKNEYEYSGHGIKDGKLYSVRSCVSCFSAGKPSALKGSEIEKLQSEKPLRRERAEEPAPVQIAEIPKPIEAAPIIATGWSPKLPRKLATL